MLLEFQAAQSKMTTRLQRQELRPYLDPYERAFLIISSLLRFDYEALNSHKDWTRNWVQVTIDSSIIVKVVVNYVF